MEVMGRACEADAYAELVGEVPLAPTVTQEFNVVYRLARNVAFTTLMLEDVYAIRFTLAMIAHKVLIIFKISVLL